MTYHLLTGATGLLGSYLLRDCLRAGRSMAVLVRPTRSESARQRIDSILTRWEREAGRELSRPVVLQGDLNQLDLGLDARSLRWITEHCGSVIHNAASLTFRGSDRQGEPWLSNLEGTRRVLELCRRFGIRQFHHVSTAYVCGLRRGRILEDELDLDQEFGNDYERSKCEAEKMVRAADFIDPPTIYRPAIIVGDSRTAFTTTYNGFYAPLKLAHTMVSKVVRGATAGRLLVAALGLLGQERKNFVPVDWVSAVTSRILFRPGLHGRTYHLTPRRPVSVAEMAEVIQEAVEAYSTLANPSDQWTCDGDWFEETFRKQMDVFQEYLHDDPEFDLTNTTAAAPDLPCPEVNREVMMLLAKYAIQSGFGRPRPRPIKPEFDVHHHLQPLLRALNGSIGTSENGTRLGLQVDGPGGGQWELMLKESRPVAAKEGISSRCTAMFCLNSNTYQRLATRQLSVAQAVKAGRVLIEGNGMEVRELAAVLQATVTSDAPHDPERMSSPN